MYVFDKLGWITVGLQSSMNIIKFPLFSFCGMGRLRALCKRVDAVLALCMEEIKESAISNSSIPPKIWKRYVDDSFCIIGKDDVSSFHDTLNSIDTNISFTIETECNGKIAFLDTLVSRRNGAIIVDVYRKPTHTDRYLDFNSHHDNRHKARLQVGQSKARSF